MILPVSVASASPTWHQTSGAQVAMPTVTPVVDEKELELQVREFAIASAP